MAHTNSISFPYMLDPSSNSVSVVEDNKSIVNRCRLLILTEPTEQYHNPTIGVGLKKYIWQYNSDNTKAVIQDKIREQLRQYEPCVDADNTKFADGLLFTGSTTDNPTQEYNQLKMTVGLQTIYGDEIEIKLDDLQTWIDAAQGRV